MTALRQPRFAAIIAAVITGVLLLLITPFPRGFQGEVTGDVTLVKRLEGVLGSHHWHHAAVAKVHGEEVTWASRRTLDSRRSGISRRYQVDCTRSEHLAARDHDGNGSRRRGEEAWERL